MLEVVELTFTFCSSVYPTEIRFHTERYGIVALIQTCLVRAFMLDGVYIFYDSGLEGISSAPFLERLELLDCKRITGAGVSFVAPRLSSLTISGKVFRGLPLPAWLATCADSESHNSLAGMKLIRRMFWKPLHLQLRLVGNVFREWN